MLAMFSVALGIAAASAPAFAWNKCGLTLSPISQSTSVPAGPTTFTFLLTYSESSNYASHFTFTTQSSNPAWLVSDAAPSRVPATGDSDSISQVISVVVTAPAASGSTTTITLTATNYYDNNANCQTTVVLTSTGQSTVPEFPLGMGLLLIIAVPVLVLVRSRYSGRYAQSPALA